MSQEILNDQHVVVVGCGALGKNVAMSLASMGIGTLTLVDFDNIEEVNLGTQGWPAELVGRAKTEALAALCVQLNPALRVFTLNQKIDRPIAQNARYDGAAWTAPANWQGATVICCVDKMSARADIASHLWELSGQFIDGRMAGLTGQVLAKIPGKFDLPAYCNTLVNDDAQFDGACTMQSTYFAAAITAGHMIGQWFKLISENLNELVEPRIRFDLLSDTMEVMVGRAPEEQPLARGEEQARKERSVERTQLSRPLDVDQAIAYE